jgi:NAD-dependent SIR2 family protein deacetylase
MTDVKIRELDWYLRDHLFRQSNKGRLEFEQGILPSEMIKTYLRYRNDDIDAISQLLDIVVGNLLHHQVIKMNDSHSFELRGTLRRLQCSKCHYVFYLAEAEELACLRCNSRSLAEFPNKRIKRPDQ